MEREINRRIGVATAVKQALHRTILGKRVNLLGGLHLNPHLCS